jgi:protein-S-isoprenylcysteine O-methyltransferase Ste14
MRLLQFAGLAICSVYCTIPLFWLVVHPLVQRWQRWGRSSYLLLLPIWGVFSLAAFAIAWRFRNANLYQSWTAWIPGALFILLGFALYQAANQGFDHVKVTGLAELEPFEHDQRLVTSGIRSQVRHPIYLGHFCEVFGWMLGTGSLFIAGLLGFAVITGALMIRTEDAELERRFGDAYREYRRQVPAFLPRR